MVKVCSLQAFMYIYTRMSQLKHPHASTHIPHINRERMRHINLHDDTKTSSFSSQKQSGYGYLILWLKKQEQNWRRNKKWLSIQT